MAGTARLGFFLCALLLFSSLVAADELGSKLANFEAGLNAKVSVSAQPLLSSPQAITVSIAVRNKNIYPMSIYVIRQTEGEWVVEKLLGAVAPDTAVDLSLDVEAKYDKEIVKKTRYAVVGRGDDGKMYGTFFEVNEDWAQYEQGVRSDLTNYIVSWVPSIALLMILLIIITAQIAYTSKSRGLNAKEYTLKSVIFPELTGRPNDEKIADVLINPIFILFELLFVGMLALVMLGGITAKVGADDATSIMLLSAVGAISIPLLYFFASWLFEKREEGKPLRFFVGVFVWGMFSAFLSLLVSSALLSNLQETVGVSLMLITTMLIAPVVEETIKGMGVLTLSGHHDYNDTLTGLLLGFTCGAGFAFVENWFYFAYRTNPFEMGLKSWGILILYRAFFNTLAHGFFTAAASTAIGYCKGIERLRPYAKLAFIPGLFIAIVIHVVYNLSALADSFAFGGSQALFFIFNPMMIILLATLFFLVLVFALIDEKKRKESFKREMKQAYGHI